MITVKEYKNQVCYIEIDRPKRMNSLAKETIEKLIDFLKTSANSPQFNVLVISGSNGFFSAGADLKWMQKGIEQSYEENYEDAQLFNQLYQEMSFYPKPIIAKVERGAFGGAIGLMACSDVVITSPDAIFRFTETSLGLVPATVAPYVLKKVGNGHARYLLISGHQFDGEEAFNYGLAHLLVSEDEMDSVASQTAEQMAGLSVEALMETKKLINRLVQNTFDISKEVQDYCATAIAKARKSKDGKERVTAFLTRNGSN